MAGDPRDHRDYESTRRKAYEDLRGIGFSPDAARRDSAVAATETHRILDKQNGDSGAGSGVTIARGSSHTGSTSRSRFRVPWPWEVKRGD